MDVLALCRESFNSSRNQPIGQFEVPLLKDENDKPIVVYVRAMNLEQETRRDQDIQAGDIGAFKVTNIISCACNEQMQPLFKDLPIVRQQFNREMDTRIINFMSTKIADILYAHGNGELDEEKKDLESSAILRLTFELVDRLHKTPDEIRTISVKDLRYILALDEMKRESNGQD